MSASRNRSRYARRTHLTASECPGRAKRIENFWVDARKLPPSVAAVLGVAARFSALHGKHSLGMRSSGPRCHLES
jgi:hypothetical protein